ncbi:uncharacterized protein LOC143042623 isoform X2 [Mytilus galloprovincialis]|uniref:uncharacterized protein LOC143042623 isoform X2 n=1 Tax=Mytilus galloprovincialis TaxID=29158 RepID=UPI003F7CCCEB
MFPSPASGRKSWNSSPKSVDDMTFAQENGTAFTTPGALEIDTTSHAHELKKKDKELLDILKKHKPEDADIDKININKELDDAINGLQANIENDIDSLKVHKEMNLCLINTIKNERTVLRDEKHYIEKQLELASRNCSTQNKRKSKEVYLLNIAYDKLDQKERSSRRRIAILQAELSLIILKLDESNSKEEKSVVPPLDMSKHGECKVLPPFKNAPKALILQNYEFVRPAPSVRDNRKMHPNRTGTLNGPRNQSDKKTVRQVIYKNKPVITRKDEGTQSQVLKLPGIFKESQMMDKSKIVPKQSCGSTRIAPRRAARKPTNQQRPTFCF